MGCSCSRGTHVQPSGALRVCKNGRQQNQPKQPRPLIRYRTQTDTRNGTVRFSAETPSSSSSSASKGHEEGAWYFADRARRRVSATPSCHVITEERLSMMSEDAYAETQKCNDRIC